MTHITHGQIHHVIVHQIFSVSDYSTTWEMRVLDCQEEEGLKDGFPARELDGMAYIFQT
jgi:hypothetical protein